MIKILVLLISITLCYVACDNVNNTPQKLLLLESLRLDRQVWRCDGQILQYKNNNTWVSIDDCSRHNQTCTNNFTTCNTIDGNTGEAVGACCK